MRISEYPDVVVRIACRRCSRAGRYRLARLADKHGAEIGLLYLIDSLAADCKLREKGRRNIYDRCGAYFPDLDGSRPPDMPDGGALRVVPGGRRAAE